MRAVGIREHGTVDQVEILDVPKPEPGPGHVLLRVRAAALNRLDLYTIQGIPGLKLQMPHILGSDGAGEVAALGQGVSGVKEGDRVTFNPGLYCGHCARCLAGEQSECDRYMILGEHASGTMADYVVVPASNLYKIPSTLSFDHAAAASLVYQTAWRMLITKGRVKPGDIVVVLGAGSGLSTAAIQIASRAGAHVIATSSSDEKLERARSMGATNGVNYAKEDWGKAVWKLTEKQGADLIVDAIGKETLNTSLRTVRKGGTITVPGGTTGQVVDLDLRYLFWKQVNLLGSTMGSVNEYRHVMDLVAGGVFVPVIGQTFAVDDAPKAFQTMAANKGFGKLVVQFDGA